MTYITVGKINKESLRQAFKNNGRHFDITDGNAVHKHLTKCFDSSRANAKILYRLMPMKNEIYLYIQSNEPFERAEGSLPGVDLLYSFEIDPANDGDIVSFDLLTWPNVCNGKDKAYIRDPEKRREWLNRTFAKNGACLLDSYEYKYQTISAKRKEGPISIQCVCFKGTLRVTNADMFNTMVSNGIGKLKNFGAGMLLYRN